MAMESTVALSHEARQNAEFKKKASKGRVLNSGVWIRASALPAAVASALPPAIFNQNQTHASGAATSASLHMNLPPTHHSLRAGRSGSNAGTPPFSAAVGNGSHIPASPLQPDSAPLPATGGASPAAPPAPSLLTRAITSPGSGPQLGVDASSYRSLSKPALASVGSPKLGRSAARDGAGAAAMLGRSPSLSSSASALGRSQTMLLRPGDVAHANGAPATGGGTLSGPLAGASAPPKVLLSGSFACTLVREILLKWLTLFDKHSAAKGGVANSGPQPQLSDAALLTIRDSAEYRQLCHASILFQHIDLTPGTLTHPQRLSLYLNLYHCLLLQSIIHAGSLPKSDTDRVTLYHGCMYALNGVGHLSLAMFEHALIRDSNHTPSSLSVFEILPRFSAKSGKRAYVLTEKEPLLTFAISNGSRSSPPIVVFDEQTVCSGGLRDAARHYLSANSRVDIITGEIVLPMLLRWYRADILPTAAGSVSPNVPNGSAGGGDGGDSKTSAAAAIDSSIENSKLIAWAMEHLTESQVFDIQSLRDRSVRIRYDEFDGNSFFYYRSAASNSDKPYDQLIHDMKTAEGAKLKAALYAMKDSANGVCFYKSRIPRLIFAGAELVDWCIDNPRRVGESDRVPLPRPNAVAVCQALYSVGAITGSELPDRTGAGGGAFQSSPSVLYRFAVTETEVHHLHVLYYHCVFAVTRLPLVSTRGPDGLFQGQELVDVMMQLISPQPQSAQPPSAHSLTASGLMIVDSVPVPAPPPRAGSGLSAGTVKPPTRRACVDVAGLFLQHKMIEVDKNRDKFPLFLDKPLLYKFVKKLPSYITDRKSLERFQYPNAAQPAPEPAAVSPTPPPALTLPQRTSPEASASSSSGAMDYFASPRSLPASAAPIARSKPVDSSPAARFAAAVSDATSSLAPAQPPTVSAPPPPASGLSSALALRAAAVAASAASAAAAAAASNSAVPPAATSAPPQPNLTVNVSRPATAPAVNGATSPTGGASVPITTPIKTSKPATTGSTSAAVAASPRSLFMSEIVDYFALSSPVHTTYAASAAAAALLQPSHVPASPSSRAVMGSVTPNLTRHSRAMSNAGGGSLSSRPVVGSATPKGTGKKSDAGRQFVYPTANGTKPVSIGAGASHMNGAPAGMMAGSPQLSSSVGGAGPKYMNLPPPPLVATNDNGGEPNGVYGSPQMSGLMTPSSPSSSSFFYLHAAQRAAAIAAVHNHSNGTNAAGAGANGGAPESAAFTLNLGSTPIAASNPALFTRPISSAVAPARPPTANGAPIVSDSHMDMKYQPRNAAVSIGGGPVMEPYDDPNVPLRSPPSPALSLVSRASTTSKASTHSRTRSQPSRVFFGSRFGGGMAFGSAINLDGEFTDESNLPVPHARTILRSELNTPEQYSHSLALAKKQQHVQIYLRAAPGDSKDGSAGGTQQRVSLVTASLACPDYFPIPLASTVVRKHNSGSGTGGGNRAFGGGGGPTRGSGSRSNGATASASSVDNSMRRSSSMTNVPTAPSRGSSSASTAATAKSTNSHRRAAAAANSANFHALM